MGSDAALPGRVAFDRDADGRVSRAEFAAALDREFARLDANEDGAVERAELVRTVEAPAFRDRMGGGAQPFVLRRRAGQGSTEAPESGEGPGAAG